MDAKYDSVVAARYLLALAYKQDIVLNTTKVQKLLFIAYGIYLTAKDQPLVDETPKAWPYGPVFPKTRKNVDYGIVQHIDDNDFDTIRSDDYVTTLFNEIIKAHAKTSATQLSEWSHNEGSPWHRVRNKPNFKWNDPIPDKYIKDYFREYFKGS